MLGSSEYSVSYETAIGFGVDNQTFLNSLEGMYSVKHEGLNWYLLRWYWGAHAMN